MTSTVYVCMRIRASIYCVIVYMCKYIVVKEPEYNHVCDCADFHIMTTYERP